MIQYRKVKKIVTDCMDEIIENPNSQEKFWSPNELV